MIEALIQQQPFITVSDYAKEFLNLPAFEVKEKPNPLYFCLSANHTNRIVNIVCSELKVHFATINVPSRKNIYTFPRFAIMYYLRKYDSISLKATGKLFKGKKGKGYDHTTVIYAASQWEVIINSPQYRELKKSHLRITEILEKLN